VEYVALVAVTIVAVMATVFLLRHHLRTRRR
jgi:hypothetical protein